ncbi:MAG: histidine kinase [Burkholderiaceae bacterium]|nr:histidine kinase [Burkholderiaceae bacterium]
MARTDEPAAAADAGNGDTVSRAPSLWPDTAQLRRGSAGSTFEVSRFDPLHEQTARERWRLATRFDLCRPALALRVLLFVQIAVALAALPLALGWADAAARAAVLAFAALAASLLWLPAVCALRPLLLRLRPRLREAALAALGAGTAAFGWGLVAAPGLVPASAGAGLGAAIAGAALALLVWHWLGLRAAAAQPVEASARLAELQSRIRPHFLFNALNTALALVQVNPRQAETVLEDLAQLFRVALAESGSAVTLDEEIDLAQRYLAIEKLRFGDRLQLVWDLDPAAAAAPMPPLVLQPLVENAVRHGIEPALDGGRIVISTKASRGMAVVMVTNTLPGVPGRSGNGIALANVAERLRLLHDVAATLHTGAEHGLYNARIEVPL